MSVLKGKTSKNILRELRMNWKQSVRYRAVFLTCMLQHATTKTGSPMLCFMGLSGYLEIFFVCYHDLLQEQAWPQSYFKCAQQKPPKRERRWDEGSATSKCSAALPESLQNFVSVTNSPCLSGECTKAYIHPRKSRKSYTVTKETSAMCAKPSLAAKTATCWILSLGKMDMVQPLP